jgi:hypothetical protein
MTTVESQQSAALSRRKVLCVGESTGSAEALEPLARELLIRGHEVEILATGSVAESEGFANLPYRHAADEELDSLASSLTDVELLIVGVTGSHSAEAELCTAARSLGIPSVGVLDNVDNVLARLPYDAAAYPDLLVLSGKLPPVLLSQAPIPWLESQNRFLVVDNLRRDSAARRQNSFRIIGRAQVLREIFAHPGTSIPVWLNQAELLPTLISGEAKLIVLYSQNIVPTSPFWRSYGHDEAELAQIYAGSLIVTAKTLATIRKFPKVYPAIRPHPRETPQTSLEIATELGAIYLPADASHSLDLAMAAGHIVSPAGSMIDQGPFHGVRTAALLFEQCGPFPYESLHNGSVLIADHIDEVESTIHLLISDDQFSSAQWSQRLQNSGCLKNVAAAAVDRILNQLARIAVELPSRP